MFISSFSQVITAAHCIYFSTNDPNTFEKASKIKLYFSNQKVKEVDEGEVIVHSEFAMQSPHKFDIALIKVDVPETIPKIRMNFYLDIDLGNNPNTFIGITEKEKGNSKHKRFQINLRNVKVGRITKTRCRQIDQENALCMKFKEEGFSAEDGDSGKIVLFKYIVLFFSNCYKNLYYYFIFRRTNNNKIYGK